MKFAILISAIVAGATVSPASAAHWDVDYAKSRLGFTVRWSGEPLTADFKSWKADIDFDAKDLAHSKVAVSVDLTSEYSGLPDNDDGIQGAQGFQVSQFPTAQFKATKFTPVGGSIYEADGALTIRGITRPIRLRFRLLQSGDSARVTGGADVSRLDFGLGQGEWADEKVVAHRVSIHLEMQAHRRP
ncbi:MAG TPA: YceI family protein [Rhizomicrobium sp.]|jgi:polyisoprenoid-binding protein YceI|nr:YceI family protein [Rhizomicrobium sp.]